MREDRLYDYLRELESETVDDAGTGVAPGRHTLTERLAQQPAPRPRATMAPEDSAAAKAPPVSQAMIDDAFRPDLSSAGAPIQAKLVLGAAGGGEALPAALEASMAASFATDFSAVRVQRDSSRVAELGAHALASAETLHFAPGAYDPGSSDGRALIGHELAHVVQQRQGRVAVPQAKAAGAGVAVTVDPMLEREADEAGARAARGEPAAIGGGASASASASVVQPMLMLGFDGVMMAATGVRNMFRDALRPGLIGRDVPGGFAVRFERLLDDGGFLVRREDGTLLRYAPDGEHYAVADEPLAPPASPPSEAERATKRQATSSRGGVDDEVAPFDLEQHLGRAPAVDDAVPDEAPLIMPGSNDELQALLEGSTADDPLDQRLLDHARGMIALISGPGARLITGPLSQLLDAAQRHRQDYDAQVVRREPARRRPRAEDRQPIRTYAQDDEASEVSDQESDADERLDRDDLVWSATANHSHGFGDGGREDSSPFERQHATGLPHADTYAAFLKAGSLVPRQLNGQPNRHGARRPMAPVQAHLDAMRPERDAFYVRLDALRARAAQLHGTELRTVMREINDVIAALRVLLSTRARPHLEGVLFGSSLRIDEEDVAASRGNREARVELQRRFLRSREESPASLLARQRPGPELHGAADTDTHAEQSIINSRAWLTTVGRLTEAIARHVEDPAALREVAESRIDLLINRTTCLGCGRELMLELVRFWTEVAGRVGAESWRAAKERFAPYVRFRIQTPAIYERGAEERSGYANLEGIVRGLEDAGWQVVITRGLAANDGARERNQQARDRVAGWTGRPGGAAAPSTSGAAALPPVPEVEDDDDGAMRAGIAASMVGAYELTAGQRAQLEAWGRVEIKIDPDGNCLFNAFAATQGVAGGGAAVRARVLAALRDESDARFAHYRELANFQQEFIANLAGPRPFDFGGEAGDAMPQIVAAVYGVTIQFARSDGSVGVVGAGPPVRLIYFNAAGLHYHGTRPA